MKATGFFLISMALAGCGKLEFSQTPLHVDPPYVMPLGISKGVEQVAGSTAMGGSKTSGNYTVDASVGTLTDQQKVKTGGNYTVYGGVRGINNSP